MVFPKAPIRVEVAERARLMAEVERTMSISIARVADCDPLWRLV